MEPCGTKIPENDSAVGPTPRWILAGERGIYDLLHRMLILGAESSVLLATGNREFISSMRAWYYLFRRSIALNGSGSSVILVLLVLFFLLFLFGTMNMTHSKLSQQNAYIVLSH